MPRPPKSMVSAVPTSNPTYFQARPLLMAPASEPGKVSFTALNTELIYAEGTLVPSSTERQLPPLHDGGVRTSCPGARNP